MGNAHRAILFAAAFVATPMLLALLLPGCESAADNPDRSVGRWVAAGVLVTLTGWLVLTIRREWRVISVDPGHCTGCGYDLRESDDRCPECGRSFKLP